VIDLGELFNRLGPIVGAIDESKVNEFLDTSRPRSRATRPT
jgi:hypothetical protein